MSQVLTPTMINEKTQLGKVVSLLKGLERHFYAGDETSIFYFKKFRAHGSMIFTLSDLVEEHLQ